MATTSNSRLTWVELCAAMSNLEQFVSLDIAPVLLAIWMSISLWIVVDILCKNILRTFIAASLRSSQRSRDDVPLNRSARE